MRLPLIGQIVWDRAYEAGQKDALAKSEEAMHAMFRAGAKDALVGAVQRVEALNAERGYDMTSEFYSETGNDYAEGWVDLLGLVIAAIKGDSE